MMNKLAQSQETLRSGANRLYTKSLKIENNGVLIENVNTTNVNFISGKSKGINNILLNNNAVPIEFRGKFINISNEQQRLAYEVFSDAAFDGINLKRRTNDTEIKFIEWFLTEQWSKGNKFIVELESVLYSCPSCQRHLMMLVEYGKINGKTINIKFIAHPKAKRINNVKEIINTL